VGFELITLVVIGTDCTGSCKSNYHAITTTTATKYIVYNWGHMISDMMIDAMDYDNDYG
jgi:hypothetical protein